MSRGYNARRKAKRQQARASAQASLPIRRRWLRRWVALIPILAIAVILAVVAALGFGTTNRSDKEQVELEVTALLDGIPQRGSLLGSPHAPITLLMYGDLECPTVRLFVENYLPSLIDTWVRDGTVRIGYRSLETDTSDEEVFFRQEIAALAAGRQNKTWNFILTFAREQGEPQTNYSTDEFLVDIAAQIPGLSQVRWKGDRADARLSKRVAVGVYSGHNNGFRSTPSFLVGFTKGVSSQGSDMASLKTEFEASLESELESLQKEAVEDFPTLKTFGPDLLGG